MRVIGKFREIYRNNTLPSINSAISKRNYDKQRVLDYLIGAKKGSISPAILKDVISGEQIDIQICCYTDGIYAWRSDLIYYVEKYDIALDEQFIKHVNSKTNDR